MSLPEGHEEGIKEAKEIKILTSNKLLTKFLIVLPQTKAGNNSYKLKKKKSDKRLLPKYKHSKDIYEHGRQ